MLSFVVVVVDRRRAGDRVTRRRSVWAGDGGVATHSIKARSEHSPRQTSRRSLLGGKCRHIEWEGAT